MPSCPNRWPISKLVRGAQNTPSPNLEVTEISPITFYEICLQISGLVLVLLPLSASNLGGEGCSRGFPRHQKPCLELA